MEKLAKELSFLDTKEYAAKQFVANVQVVQANALAAIKTAEEGLANAGKTPQQLYEEG